MAQHGSQYSPFPVLQHHGSSQYTHHSATIKQWCFINPIWTNTQTRRVNNAVLTQIMANSLMHFITLAEHSSVKSRKYISILYIAIKEYENKLQDCKRFFFFLIYICDFIFSLIMSLYWTSISLILAERNILHSHNLLTSSFFLAVCIFVNKCFQR